MNKLFILLFLATLLSGGLTGCYDDKGNYDYKEINTMDFTIQPASPDDHYRYKLRTVAGFTVTYAPVLTQSLMENEENLEFLWKVSYVKDKETVIDTVDTKELTLEFPAREVRSYTVLFSVTDVTTNVSFYRTLYMKTTYPYLNSWFVLNGEEKDRRISTIENPDSTEFIFTADAYMDMGNGRRFQNATDIAYSAGTEWLQVVEPDSLIGLSPFSMHVEKTNADLLPDVVLSNKLDLWYAVDGDPLGAGPGVLVDKNYNFYYTMKNLQGAYEEPRYSAEVKTCRAYKVTTASESASLLIWDKEQQKFMYLDVYGKGEVMLFPEEYNNWEDKDVIWLGLDNVSYKTSKFRVGMALVKDLKDNSYWAYHFDLDGYKYSRDSLGELNINENSQFATTHIFENQFFYTVDSKLYVFNVASRESRELYDAGGTISRLKFRINEYTSMGEEYDWYMRAVGMVVNKGKEGALHELLLDPAGDVERTSVFTGFGPIVDICFTFVNRAS